MGIFAGSGVGKSVLLGMMARYTSADVIVIALIGERGREVNEFIERDLGPDGLAKSVVVVATSNEPALVRTQAAATATAVAEYFRDQGKDVLLLMDSLTRYRPGAARDRPGRRRAAHHPRLSPLGLRPAAEAGGAGRPQPAGEHHRLLHRAGRGRRPQRADQRRGPRAAGRPHLALAAAGFARALSGHRRAGKPQPLDARRDHDGASPGGDRRCASCWPPTATTKT